MRTDRRSQVTQTAESVLLDTEQIEALVVGFIRLEMLGDDTAEVDRDENLLTGGLVDSVGIVRLIAHLKECLEVEVPPTDLVPGNFRTVRVMAAYMAGLQERSAG